MHRHQILIEFGGHDHWEDLRVYTTRHYNLRNIFISSGISPVFRQLPGFSTLELDLDKMRLSNLVMTSLDITSVYGKTTIPPLNEVPHYTMRFADYGINNLDSLSLEKSFANLKTSHARTLEYISDKLGFNHQNPRLFRMGLNLASTWSLISKDYTDATGFWC